MNHKNSYRLPVFALIGIVLYSCTKDVISNLEAKKQVEIEKTIEPDRLIGLGKKLENPYTVSNMLKAYNNLKENKNSLFSKTDSDGVTIDSTDYYVRFLPANDHEKSMLQEQDSLTLFDMPLDYELEEGVAGAYHDPTIPTDQITWQYTVVPVDYKFRDIKYEKLADLFLQDDYEDEEDDSSNKRVERNKISKDLWLELENEALRITGNEDDISEKSTLTARSKWYPSGTIKYEDNTTSTSRIIPLQGARIIVKRWFKWKGAITNASGYFRVGKFRSRKVKCAIKWERADWDIRSGSYGQAWYSFQSLKKEGNGTKPLKKVALQETGFMPVYIVELWNISITIMRMILENLLINQIF